MNPLLQIKNLSTYFFTDNGVIKAVDGVDLELNRGETLGIVGESGSGKSVTALSLMGLLAGTSGKIVEGEILLEGRDITHLRQEELRALRGDKIAMIFQEPMTSLNPTMRVGEQITEALCQHTRLSGAESRGMAVEMLGKVGIVRPELAYRNYPFQLSGGMRQRVMIAMALVCKPQILIADEPTTALDVTIQAQILELIAKLKEETHTSVLFITHDLGVIAEICDQVAVMYCGRVVENGPLLSIFDHPSHPYTRGLLQSMPQLGREVERLDSIPGNVPNPRHMPKGCKFAPRCRQAMPVCEEREPGFFEPYPGHRSRCWLHTEERLEASADGAVAKG